MDRITIHSCRNGGSAVALLQLVVLGQSDELTEGLEIDEPIEVLRVLDRIGPWNRARYSVEREGSRLDVELVVGTAPRRAAIGAFQGVLGCAYLLIGAFVLYRRKRGPMVRHFYAFCLSSFALFARKHTQPIRNPLHQNHRRRSRHRLVLARYLPADSRG